VQVITLDELLAGPAVKKLLFMSSPQEIASKVVPDIEAMLVGTDAESTQAVDSMLEVVPRGVNKWSGISKYLKKVGLGPGNVLAIGDGMNDYEMLLNAGCSVAMANAKQPVLDIADRVTLSNDMDGVARALEAEVLGK
jgi:hydroxymethylpyrimidine pyrophosphatase-like HAD family hydrolase